MDLLGEAILKAVSPEAATLPDAAGLAEAAARARALPDVAGLSEAAGLAGAAGCEPQEASSSAMSTYPGLIFIRSSPQLSAVRFRQVCSRAPLGCRRCARRSLAGRLADRVAFPTAGR